MLSKLSHIPKAVFIAGLSTQLFANPLTANPIDTTAQDAFVSTNYSDAAWQTSEIFGFFNTTYWPWIYHADHGWQFTEVEDNQSLWMWDSKFRWMWTQADIYPYYWTDDYGWVCYLEGSTNPRQFFVLKFGAWWEIDDCEIDPLLAIAPGLLHVPDDIEPIVPPSHETFSIDEANDILLNILDTLAALESSTEQNLTQSNFLKQQILSQVDQLASSAEAIREIANASDLEQAFETYFAQATQTILQSIDPGKAANSFLSESYLEVLAAIESANLAAQYVSNSEAAAKAILAQTIEQISTALVSVDSTDTAFQEQLNTLKQQLSEADANSWQVTDHNALTSTFELLSEHTANNTQTWTTISHEIQSAQGSLDTAIEARSFAEKISEDTIAIWNNHESAWKEIQSAIQELETARNQLIEAIQDLELTMPQFTGFSAIIFNSDIDLGDIPIVGHELIDPVVIDSDLTQFNLPATLLQISIPAPFAFSIDSLIAKDTYTNAKGIAESHGNSIHEKENFKITLPQISDLDVTALDDLKSSLSSLNDYHIAMLNQYWQDISNDVLTSQESLKQYPLETLSFSGLATTPDVALDVNRKVFLSHMPYLELGTSDIILDGTLFDVWENVSYLKVTTEAMDLLIDNGSITIEIHDNFDLTIINEFDYTDDLTINASDTSTITVENYTGGDATVPIIPVPLPGGDIIIGSGNGDLGDIIIISPLSSSTTTAPTQPVVTAGSVTISTNPGIVATNGAIEVTGAVDINAGSITLGSTQQTNIQVTETMIQAPEPSPNPNNEHTQSAVKFIIMPQIMFSIKDGIASAFIGEQLFLEMDILDSSLVNWDEIDIDSPHTTIARQVVGADAEFLNKAYAGDVREVFNELIAEGSPYLAMPPAEDGSNMAYTVIVIIEENAITE